MTNSESLPEICITLAVLSAIWLALLGGNVVLWVAQLGLGLLGLLAIIGLISLALSGLKRGALYSIRLLKKSSSRSELSPPPTKPR